MSVKLEELLTDEEIAAAWYSNGNGLLHKSDPALLRFAEAVILRAVAKAEKVEGFVARSRADGLLHEGHKAGWFETSVTNIDGKWRHALLILGPKYEPKSVKTDAEKVREALEVFNGRYKDVSTIAYEMARILRGDE